MLLEEVQHLATRIEDHKRLGSLATEAELFQTRATQLEEAAGRLVAGVAKLEALRAAGIEISFRFTDTNSLAEKTRSLREGFAANPKFVDEPGFNLRHEYLSRIAGLASSIDDAALAGWQGYCKQNSDSVSNDVLGALYAVPEFRTMVQTVQQFQMEVAALSSITPSDPATAVVRLSQIAEKQQEAWQRLTGGDLPPEIVSFLKSCATGGAPLDRLTPSVVTWLEQRKLTNSFRIRIAA